MMMMVMIMMLVMIIIIIMMMMMMMMMMPFDHFMKKGVMQRVLTYCNMKRKQPKERTPGVKRISKY